MPRTKRLHRALNQRPGIHDLALIRHISLPKANEKKYTLNKLIKPFAFPQHHPQEMLPLVRISYASCYQALSQHLHGCNRRA